MTKIYIVELIRKYEPGEILDVYATPESARARCFAESAQNEDSDTKFEFKSWVVKP